MRPFILVDLLSIMAFVSQDYIKVLLLTGEILFWIR